MLPEVWNSSQKMMKRRAAKLADSLCHENTLRQQTEQKMFKEALEYIEQHPEIKDDDILVIPHENWHHGIVGIVSSKITEKYYKPSILFAVDGDSTKGSGRSIAGFNLFGALENCSGLLESSAVMSWRQDLIKAENIEAFRKRLTNMQREN